MAPEMLYLKSQEVRVTPASDPAIRTRVWGHLPQFTYDLYLFWKTWYNSTLNNYHLLTVWPYPNNLSNRL